jgi:hypothetical protein
MKKRTEQYKPDDYYIEEPSPEDIKFKNFDEKLMELDTLEAGDAFGHY